MSGAAFGQIIPDAGSLQRDLDPSLHIPESQPEIKTEPDIPDLESSQAARVFVKEFVIHGANLIKQDQLQGQLKDLLNQNLSLVEMQGAAARIANYYRQQGWYVRVILPAQDVSNGIVTLQVIEGNYGGSILDTPRDKISGRANQGFVEQVITNSLTINQPLSASKLERGLLVANDLPGIHATGLLEAGHKFGETKLRIKVEDTPFITADAGINNYGLKATGRAQAVGGLAINNISGIGDQLQIRGLAAKDIYTGLFNYSLPLGHSGLRMGINASALEYRLGEEYRMLDAKGTAYTSGINLSYPLIRQTRHNLKISTTIERRWYNDDMFGQAIRRHRINAFSIGLAGDIRDNWFGGSISWGNININTGKLNIKDIAGDLAADKFGPRSNGGYTTLAFNLNRLQSIADTKWQILASLSGQLANKNLDSSERFSLGGPNRVRAYPVNEGTGDDGLIFKFEIQREIGTGIQATAFFDTGVIRQHHTTWKGWDGGTGIPNTYSLSGAGIGINWHYRSLYLTSSLAFPVGANKGAINQRNNDNTNSKSPTFWASLSYAF